MKTHLLLVLVALALVFSPACGKKPLSESPSRPQAVEPKPQVSPDPVTRADHAWRTGNYPESQRIYAELLQDPDISPQIVPQAWERLAMSALENHDWNGAQSALNGWARAVPDAMISWPWNRIKAALVGEKEGVPAADRFLTALLDDGDLPRETRDKAARELIRRYDEQADVPGILEVYGLQYHTTDSQQNRQTLETEAVGFLQSQPLSLLQEAANATMQQPLTAFPRNVLTGVYDLKRLEDDPDLWPQVWQDLIVLKDKGDWAGPFPFAEDLETLTARLGHPRRHIALVIPLQGPYASIGWRIAQGVGAGQWYLNSRGMDLEVTIINSEAPGWDKELADLGTTCRIVGGPLRKSSLESILGRNLEKDRAFFTFMPTVEDEGTSVWRFFGSPRDQVRAMVDAAFANGISRFAIVYPGEPYGRAMARYFWEEATGQGGTITALDSYEPKRPAAWGKTVAKLLQTEDLDKEELNPEPDFRAVFLPDTLKNAKLIVPQFFFYNENRLLFLGSQLWGQGKNPDSPLEASYFDLAIYPGGWWKNNPGPGMQDLGRILQETGQKAPDFWSALGFDFTRFASGLGCMGSTLSSQGLNEALSTHQSMSWTMAPLSWDENGLASQNYFVFQPGRTGPHIADTDHMTIRLSQREARRQARIDALNATLESNGTLDMNGTLDASPAGVQPEQVLPAYRQPVISTQLSE